MSDYSPPPLTTREDGGTRRVGIELEFSGLSLDQAAQRVQAAVGGEISRRSAATRAVAVDGHEFTVTIDWEYLIERAAEQAASGKDENWLDELSEAATMLVPVEVVCPPLELGELATIDALVQSLRAAGATGTSASLLAAYGLHINVEPPAVDVETLTAYLRSFGLLQWWLVEAHEVDTTRRLSPYIGLYPEPYVVELLDTQAPSLEALTRHYLEHNASRNRALDLLPLLAEFNQDQVRQAIDDPRIQSRPAFHYRLPNCEVDKPGWSVSRAWNIWWVVEKLASDPGGLQELTSRFRSRSRPLIGVNHSDWKDDAGTWLQEQGWV